MPENPSSLTIAEAAGRFLVDERTVRNWITSNGLPFTGEGKKRRIDWAVALPWYVTYQIGNTGNGRLSAIPDEEVETYEVALARKTRAEADLKELQLARARGEVASIADMERVVSTANLAVQTQLLAIPSQAAPEIIGLTELPAAIRILTGFVEQALTNLATIDDIRDATDAEDDEE
ncbi:helix-turn-helix domain-containing protein [Terriglobus sp. ADX1]|uniref:helix-turn-helix domain-containing protein n=1 Tax=Terriglobus sp. ADX1 TaxID=2794063 RepID=UPI002FE57E9D